MLTIMYVWYAIIQPGVDNMITKNGPDMNLS